jgi:hypothetical protein
MNELTEKKVFCINKKVKYQLKNLPQGIFSHSEIEAYIKFAYNMSFGMKGHHRSNRSGGKSKRSFQDIFINALTGKLGELAVYKIFQKEQLDLKRPDTQLMPAGEWDEYDFEFNSWIFSVKTSSHFSNLLLLEKRDYDQDGFYLPTNKQYHAHILVRIKPDLKFLVNRIPNSNNTSFEYVNKIIQNEKLSFDIPGYLRKDDLVKIIKKGFVIKQGDFINCSTMMDADNYYVQAGDLVSFEKITDYLKQEFK